MNNRYMVIAAMLLTLTAACAQTAFSQSTVKNPKFDPVLAKKLGADERGMRTFVVAILKTGPNDGTVKGKERDEVFKGHFANINRMAKEGNLVVAGPFGDKGGDWRGLYIFNVTTVDEAKKLTESDPAIKAGVFVGEFHVWYGSAAMLEVTRIHGTIDPNAP